MTHAGVAPNRREVASAAILAAYLLLRSLSASALGLGLPLYVAASGHSASAWGVTAGAFAAAMAIAEPLWGWASDRRGALLPLVVASLGPALLTPAFGLTRALALLVAIQFGRGLLEVGAAPAARQLLAHALGPGRRAAGIGLFQACGSVGGVVGPLLAGWLLAHHGHVAAFWLSAAAMLAAALLALAGRASLSATERNLDAAAPEAAGAPDALPERATLHAFARLAAIAACVFAGSVAGRSFLPLLGTEVLLLDPARVAAVLSLTSAAGGPLNLIAGRLADRQGRRPLISWGLLAVAAALAGYGVARSFVALLACSLLATAGMAAVIPAAVAMVADLTPLRRQGRMIGLFGTSEDIGIMLGPMLCGFLWDGIGPRAAFLITALVPVAGLLAMAGMGERTLRRPAEHTSM